MLRKKHITDAREDRTGKFEAANGGSLFLDEIGNLSLPLQAKLLRVIQEREIDRVGGKQPVSVDVRIIATSNRDMDSAVKNGTFREDLYFRLNVINLQLPSLANRPGDIIPLATHFAQKYAEANGVQVKAFSETAIAVLNKHPWPGNVRELENTIHRAVLLSTSEKIDTEALILDNGYTDTSSNNHATPSTQVSQNEIDNHTFIGRSVADVERDLIIDTLQHCLGNRTHAANILGISIRTLRNKLKQYNGEGFEVPQPGEMTSTSP